MNNNLWINSLNYSKIYNSIIENRKKFPLEGYTESHHILPKSLGGGNEKENLVRLSAREHFICHYLLTKMFEPKTKEYFSMIKAFLFMGAKSYNQDRYFNSRLYENYREFFSEVQSFCQSGEKNSQFGTMWIVNIQLRKNKKIKKEDQIPEGWIKGYIHDFESFFVREKEKEEKTKKDKIRKETIRLNNEEYYTKLYKIYDEHGFEYMVNFTGYDKTKQNFVVRCSKYVKEFVPQNGKPRGK